MQNKNDEGIKPSESNVGDICLYSISADKLVIVDGESFDASLYPSSDYSPVGVVVVPGYHNVYGDGSCGVMSLKEMNCSTPDDGSTSYQKIYWGGYGVDINSLYNLDKVVYVSLNTFNPEVTLSNDVEGVYQSGSLPSDKFLEYGELDNPYDYESRHLFIEDFHIPSPYYYDGSFNKNYSQTKGPSSKSNAMSDFNGVGNTRIITDLATFQNDWKTAGSITNNSGTGYYPAACCCWRYHTDGTNQGDWYLPACGELGYIMPRFNKINEAIQKMITAYGSSVGIVLYTNYNYWSSSEYSNSNARNVGTNSGDVRYKSKETGYYVRAFLRVK